MQSCNKPCVGLPNELAAQAMVGLARNISLGDFGVSNSTSCLSGSQSLLGVLVSDISVARILKMVEHNLATRIRNLINI